MPERNRLLASLPKEDRDQLLSLSTAVTLPIRSSLYEADQLPPYAYFITSGVASVTIEMADGNTTEVSMIGNEGLIGAVQLAGPLPASTRCIAQLDATALRIPLGKLRTLFEESASLRRPVLEFLQQQAYSLAQVAGCLRLHEAEERLARWLLMAQDRTGHDQLDFTQEFLAEMLGARRATVTLVAGALQRAGLIEYRRGRVKILDRTNLEAAACDCYPILKRMHDSLYRT